MDLSLTGTTSSTYTVGFTHINGEDRSVIVFANTSEQAMARAERRPEIASVNWCTIHSAQDMVR